MKSIARTIILAGCLTTIAAARAAEPDVVRVGTFKFVTAAPAYYMGVLAPKYNLKLEYLYFIKGADIIPAVVAGQVDVATTAVDAAVAARSAGIPIYVVAGYAKGGLRIVGRPDLNIASVKELKGKKVGVARGGAQEAVLYAVLDEAGLTYSNGTGKDVQLIYMAYTDINQALMRKDIDAACQPEPQASQSIRLGFGKEIIKPYQTTIGEPIRTLLFTEDLYNKRPDVARRLMECFVEATKYLIDHPEPAEKFVREVVFKNQLTHEDYVDSIGNMRWSFDATPAEVDATAQAMKKFGLGKLEHPVEGKDFVKTDLLIEAKKKLGVP
jgi:NitT/TauT family transport system substrate-binding protein